MLHLSTSLSKTRVKSSSMFTDKGNLLAILIVILKIKVKPVPKPNLIMYHTIGLNYLCFLLNSLGHWYVGLYKNCVIEGQVKNISKYLKYTCTSQNPVLPYFHNFFIKLLHLFLTILLIYLFTVTLKSKIKSKSANVIKKIICLSIFTKFMICLVIN